jgi:hypothetical protein
MTQYLQHVQKNGKFTNDAFLSVLAIAITISISIAVAIAGHSSLPLPDRLPPVLKPFPSGGVGDGLQVGEHDLGL